MIRNKDTCWGPIGRMTEDGKSSIRCIDGKRYCTFFISDYCTHKKRAIENAHDTPEWCDFRAEMAEELAKVK